MIAAGYMSGNAGLHKKYKIGATFSNVGIVAIDGVGVVIPCTTTDFADTPGLALDTATYSATQGDAEGLVTIDRNPMLIVKALMSGGAGTGTALPLLSNTAAETAGTTITDADVGSADMVSGTVWCIGGANVGQSRVITTHNSAQDFVVTVPFLNDIAAGDEFLFCPYSLSGSGAGQSDGVGNVQATTIFTQANAIIASGLGGVATVFDLELNGRTNSYVLFVPQDHLFRDATV